jgi:hypothetical protein
MQRCQLTSLSLLPPRHRLRPPQLVSELLHSTKWRSVGAEATPHLLALATMADGGPTKTKKRRRRRALQQMVVGDAMADAVIL